MKSLFYIAENTFKELIRDKILFVLLFFGFLLLILSFLVSNLSINEKVKIAVDFGISAQHLTMIILAVFLGSTLIFRELDKKTVFFVMSYPLSRTEFLVGKFFGFTLILFLIQIFLSLGLVFLLKGLGWSYHGSFLIAQLGIFLEVLILLSATFMFGVIVRPVIVVTSVIGIFLIGHGLNSFYEIAQKSSKPYVETVSEVFMWIAPNLNHVNWINFVSFNEYVAQEFVKKGIVYSLGWSLFFLILSILFFRRKDFV